MSPEFFPKTYTVLKDGYPLRVLICDAQSALLVSVLSLPLAMALSIASGCSPDRGIYTSIVAGFLISLFGGSRHQIAGPTAAFVVVIYNVVHKFGYDGLVVATIMAGLMLVCAGFFRFGTIIKYLPFPITTGFTTGIGVMLFISQFKDLFGLTVEKIPGTLVGKLNCFYQNIGSFNWQSIILSIVTIAVIIFLKKVRPKYPAFFIAFIVGTAVSLVFGLDVATIYSEFGKIPKTIPFPTFPDISLRLVMKLFPSAFTIAFLAGIESLLSCVIADSIAGTKHRSNCELIAQGIGNIASALFGGIPATGALARTATNVRSGAVTPVSGMLHAVMIFFIVLFFSRYIALIPLSCLASILLVVAIHMIDTERIRYIMRATWGDLVVFFVTLFLTMFLDITVAIEVGVILAMLFFTARMIEVTEGQVAKTAAPHTYSDVTPYEHGLHTLPNEIEMIHIAGPFFFGVASKVSEILGRISTAPRVIILDMQDVPFIDASGAFALKSFVQHAENKGINIILTTVNKSVKTTIAKMEGKKSKLYKGIVDNHEQAIEKAYTIREGSAVV
ncbi:MAG: STAS domain-containing protein [Holosporales bacterium]|nr:STAS domain-containing protein [Holosporales bacterium]